MSVSRTTRTPAFWDTPVAPWLTILVVHIRSQVKTRQGQSYKFEKIAKNSNIEIFQETLHVTHLLKLPDKMYKYEKDPTRTVGATEWKQDAGQMDGRSETNIPHNNFVVRGYNNRAFLAAGLIYFCVFWYSIYQGNYGIFVLWPPSVTARP